MKTLKLLALLSFVALIQACALPKYDYLPETVQISEPPINLISTAYVGDSLLTQGTYAEHDAIFLDAAVEVGGIVNYTFSRGYYSKTGGDMKVGFYLPSKYRDGGSVTTGLITDPFMIIEAQYSPQKLCGVTVFSTKVCKKAPFKVTKQRALGVNGFQQILIYSGEVGNRLIFGYREFSDDVSRPAFNNDVELDLEASKIIGYKGARLEILEATNELVTYKVLSNFNSQR